MSDHTFRATALSQHFTGLRQLSLMNTVVHVAESLLRDTLRSEWQRREADRQLKLLEHLNKEGAR